jgi:hypothetical protein
MSIMLLVCLGCAGPDIRPAVEPDTPETGTDAPGWWYVRFQSAWPAGQEPAWHNDLLLASEVLGPVLTAHHDQIVLWRFHRRASRDKNGHQFSFIFYASRAAAERINQHVRSSTVLHQLMDSGTLIRVRYDDPDTLRRPDLEDTSDKKWSEPLQRTWPYFIMGVSRAWFELIEQIAEQKGRPGASTDTSDLLVFYREVNLDINRTWKFEGNHAYFHHLNAIFGYQPVVVWEKRLMTF